MEWQNDLYRSWVVFCVRCGYGNAIHPKHCSCPFKSYFTSVSLSSSILFLVLCVCIVCTRYFLWFLLPLHYLIAKSQNSAHAHWMIGKFRRFRKCDVVTKLSEFANHLMYLCRILVLCLATQWQQGPWKRSVGLKDPTWWVILGG
jgi:hypothetical protein